MGSWTDENAAEDLFRATDPSDDDEPTTMAPLASQIIATMMNDDATDTVPPAPVRVSGVAPRRSRTRETPPEELGKPNEVVERAIADALVGLDRLRIAPLLPPGLRTPGVPPPVDMWALPINATEIAIFATALVVTLLALLAFVVL